MRQHHLPVQCMYLVKKDLRHFGHGQFRWRFNQKIYIKQDSFTLEKVIELCASICGVEMCGWVNSDDPWCEHAKWVPKCPYLLQEKGEGFVENVLRNRKTPKASKDLKYVKALAERKKMYEIENAILSTSRSANGSAADSQVDVSKGAVKKTVYCVGSKDDGSKGSKANALKIYKHINLLTWDSRLYFPTEGRRTKYFFTLKNPRLRSGQLGYNRSPSTWVQQSDTLTITPSLFAVC